MSAASKPEEQAKKQPDQELGGAQEALGSEKERCAEPLQALAEARQEAESLRKQMLRVQADFENAKKRWLRDQAEFQERVSGEVLGRLLEIYDDFERALAAAPEREAGAFKQGVEMIARRMQDFLKSYGVEPLSALRKPFDPAFHEAVAHEPTDEAPEGTVLEELRKGYLMNGRVLRHAVVKVAVPKTEELEGGSKEDGTRNRH